MRPQDTSASPTDADPLPAESCFAVVVARYHHSITSELLAGVIATLREAGVEEERIKVAWVPGAWELPLVAKRFAHSGKYAAVMCLGAVIKGETTHDQYINRQVSDSLGRIALDTDIPVLFGVLTLQHPAASHRSCRRSDGEQGSRMCGRRD